MYDNILTAAKYFFLLLVSIWAIAVYARYITMRVFITNLAKYSVNKIMQKSLRAIAEKNEDPEATQEEVIDVKLDNIPLYVLFNFNGFQIKEELFNDLLNSEIENQFTYLKKGTTPFNFGDIFMFIIFAAALFGLYLLGFSALHVVLLGLGLLLFPFFVNVGK